MKQIRSDLVDDLREGGYAVDLDMFGMSACESADLMDRAACFVDSALTVAGRPTSGRAYIRLSCSQGLLFVEVTHLGRGTFNAVMRDDAAMQALEQLRARATTSGRSLTIERGPRDQFRVTVVLEPSPSRTDRHTGVGFVPSFRG
jgi:hypothetical protein